MLLFVLESEFDAGRDCVECAWTRVLDRVFDRGVDVVSILSDLVAIWACEEPAFGPSVSRSDRFVVGVEKERILFIDKAI